MPQISKKQVHELAQLAGLELDDMRAETIASRLSGVLEELDMISADDLAEVEPASVFLAGEEMDG